MFVVKVLSFLLLESLVIEMECLEFWCCNFGKVGIGGWGGFFVGVFKDEEDLKWFFVRVLCFGVGYMIGGEVLMKEKIFGKNCGKEKIIVCRGMDMRERM